MKKVLAILSVLILAIGFTACGAEEPKETAQTPAAEQPVQPAPPPETVPAPKKDVLALAREGKVDGLGVAIGSSLQEAISQLGEPVTLDYFEGTSFVSYEVVDLMLDKIVENTKGEATISGILVSEGYELYGVKVGMSPAQIKVYLGEPAKEGLEEGGEGQLWKMDYDCGAYVLSFFSADKDSGTLSAYLSIKQ